MLILAVDSSGPSVSVAIWRDNTILAETLLNVSQPHSATLMPLAASLLDTCGLTPTAPDAYACAIGPGSFTGIRIGVSAVQGMAYAAGKPAVGISTLEAMAWPYSSCPGLLVCPILDARNRRVYAGAWLELEEIVPSANRPAAEFVELLSDLQNRPETAGRITSLLLVGHQPAEFFQPCGKAVLPGTVTAPAALSAPRAGAIAELAQIRLEQGAACLPQQLAPLYLAVTQAERRQAGHRESNHA